MSMASKNDKLYGAYTTCPICQEGFFEHGLPRHLKTHGMAFNCQGQCQRCKHFVKTTSYPQSLCQSCFRPSDVPALPKLL